MTFKDNLGMVARTMFALIGVLLLVVAVATMYGDWPTGLWSRHINRRWRALS